jgi:hypothetical protein
LINGHKNQQRRANTSLPVSHPGTPSISALGTSPFLCPNLLIWAEIDPKFEFWPDCQPHKNPVLEPKNRQANPRYSTDRTQEVGGSSPPSSIAVVCCYFMLPLIRPQCVSCAPAPCRSRSSVVNPGWMLGAHARTESPGRVEVSRAVCDPLGTPTQAHLYPARPPCVRDR